MELNMITVSETIKGKTTTVNMTEDEYREYDKGEQKNLGEFYSSAFREIGLIFSFLLFGVVYIFNKNLGPTLLALWCVFLIIHILLKINYSRNRPKTLEEIYNHS